MKNIHILPTDKPSRLFYNVGGALLFTSYKNHNGVNVYITSDEKLPYDSTIFHTGAFYHRDFGGDIHIINKDTHYPNPNFCKRIILTTDQDLIKDGVQAIDDEFLEWFVKNTSCEHVTILQKGATTIIFPTPKNDIISDFIKKEEPKQETLEEYIERETKGLIEPNLKAAAKAFIRYGAKWQAEKICDSEFIQLIRATKSDAEARRIIRESFK